MQSFHHLVAPFVVFLMAGPGIGQAIYACPEELSYPGFDDGQSEFIWKLGNPSGPSDYFSVDFDATLAGLRVVAIAPAIDDSSPALVPRFARVGIYPDNPLFLGATPDLSNPIAEVQGTGIQRDGDCQFLPFVLPDGPLLMGNGGLHLVFQFAPGDSSLWLCGDSSDAPAGRSYHSADGFLSPATQVNRNHMIRVGVLPPDASAGMLLFNGAATTTVQQLDTVVVSFYGSRPGQLWALYGAPPLPVSRMGPVQVTGQSGSYPRASSFCGTIQCNAPVGLSLNFNAFYLDAGGKIRQSLPATLTVTDARALCGHCFGQADDGDMDMTAFKVNQPAGTEDYFNVKHGSPSPSSMVNVLTGVDVATWDFCGTAGPGHWEEVGIYPADLVADAAGRVPDLAAPIANVGGLSAPVPPNAADWGYPARFYDTTDVPANTTVLYHSTVQWVAGDSCLWIGADSNGTGPDPCGSLPGTTSFSTSDGYTTFPTASSFHWMIKIDWF